MMIRFITKNNPFDHDTYKSGTGLKLRLKLNPKLTMVQARPSSETALARAK